MNKEEAIEFDGTVIEALPDGRFRVRLDNGHGVMAYASGRRAEPAAGGPPRQASYRGR